ncbi:MAG: hypothetical protein AB7O43_18370 [Hyphomicrobiaceae bacterium]
MPNMRAKMKLQTIEQNDFSDVETLYFSAVAAHAYPADGSDENNTYAKFTPSADLKIMIANPALIGKFKPGETYYIDFHQAD